MKTLAEIKKGDKVLVLHGFPPYNWTSCITSIVEEVTIKDNSEKNAFYRKPSYFKRLVEEEGGKDKALERLEILLHSEDEYRVTLKQEDVLAGFDIIKIEYPKYAANQSYITSTKNVTVLTETDEYIEKLQESIKFIKGKKKELEK